MGEWREYKLSDIVLSANTGLDAIRRAPIVEEETGIKCLRIQDISQKKPFSKWGNSKVTSKDFVRAQLLRDDIIMARTCSPGIVFKVKENLQAVFNNGLAKIRPNKNLTTADYLFYLFKSNDFIGHIYGISDGTSVQLNMKLGDLLSYKTMLPPLPEQTAIASVLSSLDDKIDLLHRQNATLEKMAETLFRQWFVEEAKEEWEETTLANHTEVFRGLSYKGSGLSEVGAGLPMHNLNSIYEGGGYKYEGIKFYKGEYKERHLANPGDIIVTNTEQGHEFKLIGFPAIVPEYYGIKGLFSQHIYKLIPLDDSYLSNEFIYYLLMTPAVREQIIAATNGSTVNMLAVDGLQRPEFKLPPKKLVDDFTVIVSRYWKKKNVNHTQIRTLTALRDTLLPKLMSGEMRVKP